MTQTILPQIKNLANVLDISPEELTNILAHIGLGTIGNEASRQAILHGLDIPDSECFAIALKGYLD